MVGPTARFPDFPSIIFRWSLCRSKSHAHWVLRVRGDVVVSYFIPLLLMGSFVRPLTRNHREDDKVRGTLENLTRDEEKECTREKKKIRTG